MEFDINIIKLNVILKLSLSTYNKQTKSEYNYNYITILKISAREPSQKRLKNCVSHQHVDGNTSVIILERTVHLKTVTTLAVMSVNKSVSVKIARMSTLPMKTTTLRVTTLQLRCKYCLHCYSISEP